MSSRKQGGTSTTIKSQLYSFNGRDSDNDDGKYPDSSDRGGKYEKRQSYNKGNPALTRKGGIIKNKIIDYSSSSPDVVFNVVQLTEYKP